MAKNLVIVESPAKVKTIKKFLGSNYEVLASQGHVRDLPKSQLGFDAEHDYEPKYITIRGKGEILAKLRKEAKKADKIYLATDPDREGEAISWHLSQALNLEGKKVYRITFNEITKTAVKESLKHAREIDMNLVNAQQARRMLDRMVGYRISPILWAKVKRGLSAGRVQSVALRLIADREEEINAFVPEEYWTLDAVLNVKGEKRPLTAKFYGTEKNKMTIRSKQELDEIVKAVENGKMQEACIHFRAALFLEPDMMEAMYNYARVCREMYQSSDDENFIGMCKAESTEAFEKLTEDYPDFDQPYFFLGYAYLNMGLYEKAGLAWEKFIPMAKDPHAAQEASQRLREIAEPRRIEAGCNAVISGRYAEGIGILSGFAASGYETWWPLHFYLGAAYEELGELDAAEREYRRTLQLNAADIGSMDGLIRIYKRLGQSELAEKYEKKKSIFSLT